MWCATASQPSFNTQPPEGGWDAQTAQRCGQDGFNTQPPEGGWFTEKYGAPWLIGFNTQPPEGGWMTDFADRASERVSTHSRLKAAGHQNSGMAKRAPVSTHSRLKAAGHRFFTL